MGKRDEVVYSRLDLEMQEPNAATSGEICRAGLLSHDTELAVRIEIMNS